MIPQSQISLLSNRLFREQNGRRIPEHILERDYCIAWFLIGLSRIIFKEKIAFKGGTALKRCHFPDYRFSEDLDFTIVKPFSFDELKKEFELIYAEVKKASNVIFKFAREDTAQHTNSHTFYLSYEGPLPTNTPKDIKVDITINETIGFQLEELPVLQSYSEFSDLPSDAKIFVYSLNEIAVEKTVALLDPARTEPRDLYDLWFLTQERNSVNLDECLNEINSKLSRRNRTLADVQGEFAKKETRLKKAWEKRLSAQMSKLPELDNVYRAIKRVFRQAKITNS